VDFVGDSHDQSLQKGRCCMSVSFLMELGESELRCAIDCDEQMELALLSTDLGDIDVEVADRIALERLLAPRLAFDRREPADLVALEQSMQR